MGTDYARIFIGGSWRLSHSSERITVENPASEQAMAEIPAGDLVDVAAAVAAAREALDSWGDIPVSTRCAVLARMADCLTRDSESLAATISAEVGTPRHLAQRMHVEGPLANFRIYAETAATMAWQEDMGGALVRRVPVGVVAAITPWNFPLNQALDKIGAALVAGCTIVFKPSELAPLTAWSIAEAAEKAGLPPGVLNLVSGPGSTVGEGLVVHPDVDMVSFTGSTRAGKRILGLAAEAVKRVALELGGKSASIVLDNTDLEAAVTSTVRSCFTNSGQVCTALSRLLVPAELYDEAVTLAADVAVATTVGDPSESVEIGPLISRSQRDRVRGYIEAGMHEGARLVVGGHEPPDGLRSGYYVRPTVFAEVTSDMTIAQEEIFGPVLSVLRFDDEDEAVELANGTPYGLSGAVWSSDSERARSVARRIRTGTVRINGAAPVRGTPFGGFKQSGLGREKGRWGIEEFLETQTITSNRE